MYNLDTEGNQMYLLLNSYNSCNTVTRNGEQNYMDENIIVGLNDCTVIESGDTEVLTNKNQIYNKMVMKSLPCTNVPECKLVIL